MGRVEGEERRKGKRVKGKSLWEINKQNLNEKNLVLCFLYVSVESFLAGVDVQTPENTNKRERKATTLMKENKPWDINAQFHLCKLYKLLKFFTFTLIDPEIKLEYFFSSHPFRRQNSVAKIYRSRNVLFESVGQRFHCLAAAHGQDGNFTLNTKLSSLTSHEFS